LSYISIKINIWFPPQPSHWATNQSIINHIVPKTEL
jgi:hypothetical protein